MPDFQLETISHILGVKHSDLEASLKKEDETFFEGDELSGALRSFVDTNVIKPKLEAREKQVLGRAKRESMEGFEKEISEKFGIKEKKQGIELIDFLVEIEKSKVAGVSGKTTDLGEEDLFKMPAVQKILSSHVKERDSRIAQLESAENALKLEYSAYKGEIENREVQSKIDNALIAELEKLNVQFSDDSKKRALQIRQFLISVKQSEKFGFDDKGQPTPIGEDGNTLYRNARYQTLADIVEDYNTLPKAQVDTRIQSHSPVNGQTGGNKVVKKYTLPADVAADKSGNKFWDMHAAETDKEIKKAMFEAYKAL